MKRAHIYKVAAAFDIETCNADMMQAFPVSYQCGELADWSTPLDALDNGNVRELTRASIFRSFDSACMWFDSLIVKGRDAGVVPVVQVHNLGFEMWAISGYLAQHECTAVCKSCVKPLTITIMDGKDPVLVFWDTFSFYGKPLATIGDECGYPKLIGSWDYLKQRLPSTPLTPEEEAYALEDIYVLWAYMGYYLRLNVELDEHDLACKLLTKTSTVRFKSLKRVGQLKLERNSVYYMWSTQLKQSLPKSDFELELMHAATRGGFTYCAANNASRVFERRDGKRILKYDANSMHPFHACSHWVPDKFEEADMGLLDLCMDSIRMTSMEDVLSRYERPFNVAFHGIFHITNIRLKGIFARDGIASLAWSRFGDYYELDDYEDNEGGKAFKNMLVDKALHDSASEDCVHAFGKLMEADDVVLILNELSAWELFQVYDFDSIEAVCDGYMTMRFVRPTDKAVLSFNNFYQAKQQVKEIMGAVEHGEVPKEYPEGFPEYLKQRIAEHVDVTVDLKNYYQSVKAELNSLYGIEATNEAKQSIGIGREGLFLEGYEGVDGLPKRPKAWYQYGMRVVGWSRVHQILFMLLASPEVDTFICGDTDSHKVLTSSGPEAIAAALQPLHDACGRALDRCTERARRYGRWYPMGKLGRYEQEDEPSAFCAGWNKSYMEVTPSGRIDITLAGVPCNTGEHSYNNLANRLLSEGFTFAWIAEHLIGYNVTLDNSITGLNTRHTPMWGSRIRGTFTDYLGNTETIDEPAAVHLFAMAKTIGAFGHEDNAINARYAKRNNPEVNTDPLLLIWINDEPFMEIDGCGGRRRIAC